MRSAAFLLIASLPSGAVAFSPSKGSNTKVTTTTTTARGVVALDDADGDGSMRPIYDPLGLYPKNSPERLTGSIRPLEEAMTTSERDRTLIDPLKLYQGGNVESMDVAMSPSLPFLKRPELLDGSLPGDRGFDPFNFSSDQSALLWYRNAEIKHARLAMLAAIGWPIAELFHGGVASRLDLPQTLLSEQLHGKVPSVLNGGLDKTAPLFWVAAIGAAAALEFIDTKKNDDFGGGVVEPGDFGFDPLGLMGNNNGDGNSKRAFFLKEAEIFNGRLAMLAITGFVAQEFATNAAVIDQTPIFFKPFGDVVAQLLGAAQVGAGFVASV